MEYNHHTCVCENVKGVKLFFKNQIFVANVDSKILIRHKYFTVNNCIVMFIDLEATRCKIEYENAMNEAVLLR